MEVVIETPTNSYIIVYWFFLLEFEYVLRTIKINTITNHINEMGFGSDEIDNDWKIVIILSFCVYVFIASFDTTCETQYLLVFSFVLLEFVRVSMFSVHIAEDNKMPRCVKKIQI